MDDGVEIETEEEIGPHGTYDGADRTKDPEFLQNVFLSGARVLQLYGWWIILASILLVYFWKRFVGAKVTNLLAAHVDDSNITALKKTDIDRFVATQERMTAARLRMQQELDEKAEKFKEEMKLKEEQKRQEKIDDWERHQKGGGYRSKQRGAADTPDTPTSQVLPTKTSKKTSKLRNDDYNPLMGDGGSRTTLRSGRRLGGGGGG